ncbi:hypothetical protein BD779DRAFT_1672909 [Infundibulicybe gibba]|nr:hypothetical protein BD779DRAFT_1672909 [Infundibulicybe gibba]
MHIKSPYPDVPPLPEMNAHHFFFNRPDQAEWPDYTIHIDPVTGFKRTYREFLERVYDGATALGAPVSAGGLGLRGGDGGEMIGIMSENAMDFITLVHSLFAITTPFALISSYSTSFELKHALSLAKPTRLFVSARYIALILPLAREAGISSRNIYVLGGHTRGRKSFSEMIDDVRAKKIPREPVRPAEKDTLAYLVFSSGTSGLPKAVMISHHNIMYSLGQMAVIAQTVAEVYTPPTPPTPEGIPITLAFLPMHHTYGLHAYNFRCFLAPSTLVILSKWNIEVALKAISKFHITHLTLIPSVVHQLVNYPKIHKANLSSVMAMNCGAAYLPAELNEKMSALVPKDVVFSEGYGMSETTVAAIGQAFPGILVDLNGFRVHGNPLPRDERPNCGNVALGYWKNEKATQEAFADGWMKTGDRFRFNEKGYFYYADRSKDTLKCLDPRSRPLKSRMCCSRIQRLIIDATVAGVSGGRTSDEKVPRAWVVLSEEGKKIGASAVTKELEAWHQENLSKYKWLRGGIEVVKEIPKSPTGKTLRRVLQDRYEQRFAKVKGKL